ncbi:SleB Cell wall hydrolyses involved in spore germination [uncultured Caudovirales phage]|uniref:SleB Cell wall hydrolyses involved in spore germination n=1 Tax=uncultured Caudovirales phage TaxID=2100421 RepID=A0A6J5MCM9_9CAUD|nr:SleB Cell wall hydrolyses involved in spore germination [uncultured Caudovirales phage]
MTNAVRGVRAADVWDLARTIYGEARGSTHADRVGVAWVVRNRLARPGWWTRHPDDGIPDDTIQATCREPMQFSCWNATDPNRKLLDALTLPGALGDPAARACLVAAIAVLDGTESDPTSGSCHYHTPGVAPAWSRGRRPVAHIGGHLFFNDIP